MYRFADYIFRVRKYQEISSQKVKLDGFDKIRISFKGREHWTRGEFGSFIVKGDRRILECAVSGIGK